METKWKRNGNKMETKLQQNGNKMETKWKQMEAKEINGNKGKISGTRWTRRTMWNPMDKENKREPNGTKWNSMEKKQLAPAESAGASPATGAMWTSLLYF
jgi:hypothetical protein